MTSAGFLPRVAIDLEKLRHLNTGLGRFSLHLGTELITMAEGRFHPVFFIPDGCESYFPEAAVDRITATEWKKESLRRIARPLLQPLLPRSRLALWHATHQSAKYLPLDSRIPVLLTIHDLNFLHDADAPEKGRGLTARQRRKLAGVQRLVDRSAAITTVSQFTADDVRRHLRVGRKAIHVIPNGVAPPGVASAARPKWVPAGAFFLTVGNCVPHKNFHVLLGMIEAMSESRLVIAGKKATSYGASMEREIVRRGLTDRVFMPGEVSDADRQWLYQNCEAFLFPSLAEGFGFPVLEAMQCGKPVFVSRATSLPEIAGEGGFFFDSFDGAAMAATVRAGVTAASQEAGRAARARMQAASFSWTNAAQKYADVYERVMESCDAQGSRGHA